MRVFEEAESEFKLLATASLRKGVCLQLFDDDELLSFKTGDAPFIGRDDGGCGCPHDAVKHLFDLLLGLAEVIAKGLGYLLSSAAALIPSFEEQVFEQASGLR
ncbi:MAG: hypothetical protein WC026_14865 [Hyphomicrobium sp.]|uniref:hypothetical protein n=1 Tax=Hyphomicrobium sp. TaxID=82 RepID=UPI00356328F3